MRGQPSVRGDAVYALAYDELGNASVIRVARDTGTLLASAAAGHHGGTVPGTGADATLTVLAGGVFVSYPLPVPSTSGAELRAGRVTRERDARGLVRLGSGSLNVMLKPRDER